MTEFEKKQNGQIYDARDPELRKQQSRAKNLAITYNSLPAEDIKERTRVLSELFGRLGKNARVNQPVYVDYGYNIQLADNSFINMHCTLLYGCPCFRRSRALLAGRGRHCRGKDAGGAG